MDKDIEVFVGYGKTLGKEDERMYHLIPTFIFTKAQHRWAVSIAFLGLALSFGVEASNNDHEGN